MLSTCETENPNSCDQFEHHFATPQTDFSTCCSCSQSQRPSGLRRAILSSALASPPAPAYSSCRAAETPARRASKQVSHILAWTEKGAQGKKQAGGLDPLTSIPAGPSLTRLAKKGSSVRCDSTYAHSTTPICPARARRHDSPNFAAAYAIDRVADPLPACRQPALAFLCFSAEASSMASTVPLLPALRIAETRSVMDCRHSAQKHSNLRSSSRLHYLRVAGLQSLRFKNRPTHWRPAL